eukprot:3995813-Amphidinium_carterae.1
MMCCAAKKHFLNQITKGVWHWQQQTLMKLSLFRSWGYNWQLCHCWSGIIHDSWLPSFYHCWVD